MNFVKLKEYNDNEGESWNFWLQLDGNEDQLYLLNKIIELENTAGYETQYVLDMDPVSEEEVDILVKHSDSGYMSYENKITGTLDLPEFDDSLFEYESEISDDVFRWTGDNLYKGSIERSFA